MEAGVWLGWVILSPVVVVVLFFILFFWWRDCDGTRLDLPDWLSLAQCRETPKSRG